MAESQNTPAAFAAQLREGQYNELRVALYFMLQKCLTRIGFADGRYDIEVQPPVKERFHVEVKWDKRAAETGNLYFEVENTRQGCPSGINATTATWWCHVIGHGGEALLAEVGALRHFLADGEFRSIHTSGADSNSRGLLVPRARLDALPRSLWIRLPTVEAYFGEVFRVDGGP